MIQAQRDDQYATQVSQEHKLMRALLDQTQKAVHAPDTSPAELRRLVLEVVHRVCGHFWHEEKGGYMRPALEVAPHLAHQAEQLRAEHAKLLDQLEELRRLVEVPQKLELVKSRLPDLFESFLAKYRTHEAAEDALMQEAFQCDISQGD